MTPNVPNALPDPNELADALDEALAYEVVDDGLSPEEYADVRSLARCLREAYVTNHDDHGPTLVVPLEHWGDT